MISLEVNTKQIVSELNGFVANIKQLTNPSVINELSKGIFSITGKRFVIAVDSYARSNPKKMHHVYEWGQIGQPEGRLFVIERSSIIDGSLIIGSKFLKSSLPVPINPLLLTPGNTGKTVTSRSIFSNKASVMEDGKSVSFVAKKILSFVGSEGLVFVSPNTQINILNPGGRGVKGAFAEFMLAWYTENGNTIMDNSGFYEKISNDVSIALNQKDANINTVKKAVKNSIISMGLDLEIIP